MFLTACCHECNPSNHLSRFHSSEEPPEFAPKMLSELSFIIPKAASIILHREKGRKKVWKTPKNLKKNKKRPQITEMPIRMGPILSHGLCVWWNMIGHLRCVTLYKLRTWQICTGLRSQTTSAIITNYWRSPGYTSPVRFFEKVAFHQYTNCLWRMLQYIGHCCEMARINTWFLNFNKEWFDAAFRANAAFIGNSSFSSQSSNLSKLLLLFFFFGRVCVHLILHINTFLYPVFFYRLCHGLVGNFLIFTSCIA